MSVFSIYLIVLAVRFSYEAERPKVQEHWQYLKVKQLETSNHLLVGFLYFTNFMIERN